MEINAGPGSLTANPPNKHARRMKAHTHEVRLTGFGLNSETPVYRPDSGQNGVPDTGPSLGSVGQSPDSRGPAYRFWSSGVLDFWLSLKLKQSTKLNIYYKAE